MRASEAVLPSGLSELRRFPKGRGGACVVTGPSGVGKSLLIKRLMAEFEGKFGFSVSHTTRDPRPGEENGKDYHFTTREKMQKEIDAGDFLEYAEVHTNIYGTSFQEVQAVTKK